MKLAALKRPLIIAHRGYRSKYPENTLASFEAALDAGAQMIELDVRMSRDRKLVVIHDATVDRATDGKGPVKDHTLEVLKELDAGCWFHPRFKGERVPGLDEVLDRFHDRTLINIEIKADTYEAHSPPDAIEKQVVELVCRKNLLDSVLISSFEQRILKNIKKMEKAPPLALLSRDPGDRDNVGLCKSLRTFSWHPRCNELKKEQVKRMHEAGIKVFPYNVDTLEELQKMTQMEVDGVIVSDPLLVRDEYGEIKNGRRSRELSRSE
jgi:glycerophosphoryl diester phosphodiesterase